MFACNKWVGVFYIGCITLLGTITIIVSWIPLVQSPEYQSFRGILFIALGLFALIPIPHSMYYVDYKVLLPIVLKLGVKDYF